MTRRGAILTTELLFVLPVLIGVSLIILQFILIHAAYQRVQTAAIEGACLAAEGASMDDIEDAVGLALGYLAVGPGHAHIANANEVVGFEVQRQFVDADGDFNNNCAMKEGGPPECLLADGTIPINYAVEPDPCIEAGDDYVVVGVRIPMNRVAPNYLGYLCGGSVDGLQLRSVVKKKMKVDVCFPLFPCEPAPPAGFP